MQDLSVSVILPTFNREHLVGRALRSALRQIGPDDEILVVDDGSTDRTESTVNAFGDQRVRYIRQPHAGAGAARNRGASEATRALVAFLDSDDEWMDGKIAIQRGFMAARPDVLFCFTDFAREFGDWRFHREIRRWHSDPRPWEQIMGPASLYSGVAAPPNSVDCRYYTGDIYRDEMRFNYILTSSLMARRSEAGDSIHFTEGVKTFEDWECFGRLARRGRAAFLDCETAMQHKHPGPRLTDAALLDCAESRLVVLNNVWGSDAAFLERHGDEYLALRYQLSLDRVRGLLCGGRSQDAREAIRKLTAVPFSYTVLSTLPGNLLVSAIQLRRHLMSLARSQSMSQTEVD